MNMRLTKRLALAGVPGLLLLLLAADHADRRSGPPRRPCARVTFTPHATASSPETAAPRIEGASAVIEESPGSFRLDAETGRRYAEAEARTLWGEGVTLCLEQEQLGAGGRAMSRMYVFSVGAELVDAAKLRDRIASGEDPTPFDETIRCLEMAVTEEFPPVIAYWTGVPTEWRVLGRAAEKLHEIGGDREYVLVRRHLTAVFPILEFEADGDRIFYNPKTDEVSRRFEVRVNPQARESERGRQRLADCRAQWDRMRAGR